MDNSQKNLTPLSQMLGSPTTQEQEVEERLNTFVATTCVRCKSDFSYQLYMDRKCAEKGWGRLAKHVCPNCLLERETRREERDNDALGSYRIACLEGWREAFSGLPARYWDKRFEAFERSLQPEAYALARRYVEVFMGERWDNETNSYSPIPSLFLASRGNGTGKTHLACAIALEVLDYKCSLIERPYNTDPPCPVLFATAPRLFLRIRATYQENAAESEQSIIDQIENVGLLILDDVGKEKASDHTRQTYFTIIDARYNAEGPMVITCNLVLPDQLKELTALMGQASVSRLKEMTEGWRVTMDGKDYRFRESKA